MEIKPTNKSQTKLKIALKGGAGTGKSMSSLLIAQGLANNDFSKIAVVDCEQSIQLYSALGNFNVINLQAPHSFDKYEKAIDLCIAKGIEVIVIDGLSSLWYYILEQHSKMSGNSFRNWSSLMPSYNKLIQKIIQAPIHIICTLRTKQGYSLNLQNGKYVPQKIGRKVIQKSDIEFEFMLVFSLDKNNVATVEKDKTQLFKDLKNFVINSATGQKLRDFYEIPSEKINMNKLIAECLSVSELIELHRKYPSYQESHKKEFNIKKRQLEELIKPTQIGYKRNGTSTY